VAYALPDVPRKPLPASVVAAAAAAARENKQGSDATASLALPPGGVKELVRKTCGTSCHSLDVLKSQRTDEKGWNAIVQNMVARGAHASDPEINAIVRYLATNFGNK
jgi:hypothetical protein